MKFNTATLLANDIINNIEKVIKGKRSAVTMAVVALLGRGHLLIEDVPGVGKTVLAKSLAKTVEGEFKRIQFTPDLLPSDVTGLNVFNQKKGDFEFNRGPIFANIILADEINRTSPRTQASLLEAMEEHQTTSDGVTYKLPEPFFVIATQNPLEYHGTYPLPENQLDRFFISLKIGYPGAMIEREILQLHLKNDSIEMLQPVLNTDELNKIIELIQTIKIEKSLQEYAVEIVRQTRKHSSLLLGASPRGTLALVRCSQALALIYRREYIIPDDIKKAARAVLPHRLMIRTNLNGDHSGVSEIIEEILRKVPVPV